MDKRWMSEPRPSEAYLIGCQKFLDFAFANAACGDEILCPCIDCYNNCWLDRKTVYEHLVCKGMDPGYKVFLYHGEDSNFVRFNGRRVTKNVSKHVSTQETTKSEREQMKEILKNEIMQEYNEMLHNALHMTMLRLKECNPTMVIPPNMFDFLLDRHANPGDAASAQRHVPTSFSATNSPTSG